MNHDITDEVMFGVNLVNVKVLKQQDFSDKKRIGKGGGRIGLTIVRVL